MRDERKGCRMIFRNRTQPTKEVGVGCSLRSHQSVKAGEKSSAYDRQGNRWMLIGMLVVCLVQAVASLDFDTQMLVDGTLYSNAEQNVPGNWTQQASAAMEGYYRMYCPPGSAGPGLCLTTFYSPYNYTSVMYQCGVGGSFDFICNSSITLTIGCETNMNMLVINTTHCNNITLQGRPDVGGAIYIDDVLTYQSLQNTSRTLQTLALKTAAKGTQRTILPQLKTIAFDGWSTETWYLNRLYINDQTWNNINTSQAGMFGSINPNQTIFYSISNASPNSIATEGRALGFLINNLTGTITASEAVAFSNDSTQNVYYGTSITGSGQDVAIGIRNHLFNNSITWTAGTLQYNKSYVNSAGYRKTITLTISGAFTHMNYTYPHSMRNFLGAVRSATSQIDIANTYDKYLEVTDSSSPGITEQGTFSGLRHKTYNNTDFIFTYAINPTGQVVYPEITYFVTGDFALWNYYDESQGYLAAQPNSLNQIFVDVEMPTSSCYMMLPFTITNYSLIYSQNVYYCTNVANSTVSSFPTLPVLQQCISNDDYLNVSIRYLTPQSFYVYGMTNITNATGTSNITPLYSGISYWLQDNFSTIGYDRIFVTVNSTPICGWSNGTILGLPQLSLFGYEDIFGWPLFIAATVLSIAYPFMGISLIVLNEMFGFVSVSVLTAYILFIGLFGILINWRGSNTLKTYVTYVAIACSYIIIVTVNFPVSYGMGTQGTAYAQAQLVLSNYTSTFQTATNLNTEVYQYPSMLFAIGSLVLTTPGVFLVLLQLSVTTVWPELGNAFGLVSGAISLAIYSAIMLYVIRVLLNRFIEI